MTELDPRIKAFVKALEEANITTTATSDLTSTQFKRLTPERLRIEPGSLDIEPGTVVAAVGSWEVFCILNSKFERRWIAYSGEIYNDYEFAELARKCNGKVMMIHEGL